MASVNNSMEDKRRKADGRQELSYLNSDELTELILDTVDAKTLLVITASLRAAFSARRRGSPPLNNPHRKTS